MQRGNNYKQLYDVHIVLGFVIPTLLLTLPRTRIYISIPPLLILARMRLLVSFL